MREPEEIFDTLINEAGHRLGAYGYALTGSVHASEELVQEALVRVLVKRRSFANVLAAEGYVRAAMRTIHIDGIRRDTTWRRLVPRLIPRPGPPPTAVVEGEDAAARLLADLPPQMRIALALHYLDDLPVAEVAHLMSVSVGTVKRHLHDGRERLRLRDGTAAEHVRVVER